MAAGSNDHQRTWPLPLPERLACATTNPLSPSDLMITPLPLAAHTTVSASEGSVALARINRLQLLQWLLAAINGVLEGEEPTEPRPSGTLLECGRFAAMDQEVWAEDWYGHRRRCLLARCTDVAAAEELAGRLNRLLRP